MNIVLAVLIALLVALLILWYGWYRRDSVQGVDGERLPAPRQPKPDKAALWAAEEAAERRLERFRGE